MMPTSDQDLRKADKPESAKKKTTRHAQLRKLLSRKTGASVAQIQKAFGWQPHTARAAISAQRKAGRDVTRSDTDKGPVYRIVEQASDQ
jgi:uncharacterized protein DUF3489